MVASVDPESILIANVAASDAYVDVWAVVLDNYGPEYFEKLKAQNFTVTESGVPAAQGFARVSGIQRNTRAEA